MTGYSVRVYSSTAFRASRRGFEDATLQSSLPRRYHFLFVPSSYFFNRFFKQPNLYTYLLGVRKLGKIVSQPCTQHQTFDAKIQ